MFDLLSVGYAGSAHFQAECRCRHLNGDKPSNLRYLLWIVDDSEASDLRSDLLEYLRHFAAHGEFTDRKARDIAARSGKVSNETTADRIGNANKHNRNRACDLLQSGHRDRPKGENDVRLAVDRLLREVVDTVDVGTGPVRVDLNIASVNPAQLTKRLNEGCDPCLYLGVGFGVREQYRDAPLAVGLLRARREWPNGHADYRFAEIPPPHVSPSRTTTMEWQPSPLWVGCDDLLPRASDVSGQRMTSEMGQSRLSHPVSPTIQCPLYSR